MLNESVKNFKLNGLLAQVALSGPDPKKSVHLWNSYVNLELGFPVDKETESQTHDSSEEYMREEYSKIQHLRPKMEMDKRGYYVVSGMNI